MGKDEPRVARYRRHARVRVKVAGTTSRPRLSIFRSLKHVYAQVIDDLKGHTLVAAASADPELTKEVAGKAKIVQAKHVGSLVAQRALAAGISEVVFDRGGYKYHGRVKAVAQAAREAGLKF